jgi:hypothetical protein
LPGDGEEAEVDAGRLLGQARAAAPAGSRGISRLRLAAGQQACQAGEQLHAALELPYPAPEALELAALAGQVLARVDNPGRAPRGRSRRAC